MRNADYWRGRFSILEDSAHQEAQRTIQDMEELYLDAQRSVQKEIERINKDKLYQTESEQAESDSLIADANSTIASKQKQIQELIADTDEINKRIEMKNREKTDLGI